MGVSKLNSFHVEPYLSYTFIYEIQVLNRHVGTYKILKAKYKFSSLNWKKNEKKILSLQYNGNFIFRPNQTLVQIKQINKIKNQTEQIKIEKIYLQNIGKEIMEEKNNKIYQRQKKGLAFLEGNQDF